MIALVKRLARFCKLVATDKRLPRWMRVLLVVCLVIPGPVDELVALVLVGGLLVVRRRVVADCWRVSAAT